jgi:O-antigen/teichoic acid export membrane protein
VTDERSRLESPVLGGLLSSSSLKRRLLSGSIWAVAGRFGGAMVSILIASPLTFVIFPEEVGAYNLALSIVSFGALVGALGLPKTVVRLVAENVGLNRFGRTRRVIYTVLSLGLVGTLLTSVATSW